MIRDYSVYELSGKEKIIFCLAGYLCIFTVVYLFYQSFAAAALSGGLVYFILPYGKKYLAQKRMDALNVQFKDMLYSLSASAAAGRQMEEALIEADDNLALLYKDNEPIRKELRHMRISITENKESDKPLLQDFARRSGSEDIRDFVQAYITCRNMGGDIEKMIVKTADIITDKMTIDRQIKVLTSQKKTEGRIISAMPLLMLLALNVFSYSYIAPLYETAAGRLIMTGALALTVYGMFLMEKMSRVEI